MSPTLAVVTDQQGIPRESLSARIRALQEEARGLAREHIVALEAALVEVERLAVEIAAGGDAYPAGVRDIARRHGLPLDRAHVMGHDEAPDCSEHDDPGPGWDWAAYEQRLRTTVREPAGG